MKRNEWSSGQFFSYSMLLLTLSSLLLAGCGLRQDAEPQVDSAGSLSRDGEFTAGIPSALQKHRQDEDLTATGLIDNSQTFLVTLDHANHRFSANIPELAQGMHTFEIRFFRAGLLFATLTTTAEILPGKDTPIAFDADSLAYAAAPKIDWTDPVDTQAGVDKSTKINVGFSQPLKSDTVTSAAFTISSSAGPLAGTVNYLETLETFEIVFTPTEKLSLLTSYTATIHAGISDISGNLLPADHVWNFKTTDGAWGTAGLIESDNIGPATFPEVAVDPNGNAIAVWEQDDGTRENIWANRFTASTGWGTPERIEINNVGNANLPAVSVDPNGNAIALWSQSDGTRDNIWVNRFTTGGGWGTAELIEFDNAGGAFDPRVAVDAAGNAIAVWRQFDGTQNSIFSNRFTPGSGWGTAELIETDNLAGTFRPQIAFDASGNAISVWYQSDGTRWNIASNRFIANIGWGTAQLIETNNSGDAIDPQIAIDASGNATVVWRHFDGTRYNVWSNRFTPGSGWGTAELIESDNAGPAIAPQVAVDANGNAIAVWMQSDGTRDNIWANRFIAIGGWGIAELIESNNTGRATSPQVAVDANGNATAVWHQSNGTRDDIWSNRFTAGSGWGIAKLIESDDTGDANFPQVGIDAAGNAIAIWSQSDGTRENILANRFQ